MTPTFSREERISRKGDILKAINRGARHKTPGASFYFLSNNKSLSRLCVIASRKNGNSCERNRVKRCYREAFRLNKHLLESGTDIIVRINGTIKKFSLKEAQSALLSSLAAKNRIKSI